MLISPFRPGCLVGVYRYVSGDWYTGEFVAGDWHGCIHYHFTNGDELQCTCVHACSCVCGEVCPMEFVSLYTHCAGTYANDAPASQADFLCGASGQRVVVDMVVEGTMMISHATATRVVAKAKLAEMTTSTTLSDAAQHYFDNR
jgi:hypothetical protein